MIPWYTSLCYFLVGFGAGILVTTFLLRAQLIQDLDDMLNRAQRNLDEAHGVLQRSYIEAATKARRSDA